MNSFSRNKFVFPVFFLAIAIVRLWLAFRLNIHWDEFLFLSQIFDLREGRLGDAFQTFHTQIFRPLLWLPFQETGLIVAGRLCMLVFSGASGLLLFRMARRTAGAGAVVAVFAWLTLAEETVHGASFRTDPLVLLLVLAAAELIAGGLSLPVRLARTLGGMLMGAAMVVSLKAIIVVGIIAPLAVPLSWEMRKEVVRTLHVALVAIAVFIGLLLLHRLSIAPSAELGLRDSSSAPRSLLTLAREFVTHSDIASATFLRSRGENPVFWMLAGVSVFLLLLRPSSGSRQILASVGMTLFVFFFYRNLFPYFLPLVAIPYCFAIAWAGELLILQHRAAHGAVLLTLFSCFAISAADWARYTLDDQRALIAAVHQQFPRPVPYVDRCGMIASFPKVGPFLSTLVWARYRASGQPIFSALIRERRPEFLLANDRSLDSVMRQERSVFFPEDAAVLRESFAETEVPMLFLRQSRKGEASPGASRFVGPQVSFESIFAPY